MITREKDHIYSLHWVLLSMNKFEIQLFLKWIEANWILNVKYQHEI